MKIREYRTADCAKIADLFYDTVHTINAKDYTKSQLDVWATGKIDIVAWDRSFTEHDTLVAEKNDMIVCFGDMDHTGYLDIATQRQPPDSIFCFAFLWFELEQSEPRVEE